MLKSRMNRLHFLKHILVRGVSYYKKELYGISQIFLIKKSITKYLSVLRKCVYMRIFAIIYSTHFFFFFRISLGIQNQKLSLKREEFFYELMGLMVVSVMSHHRIFLSLGKIIRLFFFEKILNKNLYGD